MNILNRHHLKKGKTLPPGSIYVGRGSPWGNPFVIGEHGDRNEVVDRYCAWLNERMDEGDPVVLTGLAGFREETSLVCSCAPARCHAECIRDARLRLVEAGGPHAFMCPEPGRFYAGIGSRDTPPPVLRRMTRVAERLAARGYVLRSGAARGADAAFEAGAGQAKRIYLPWAGFNGHVSDLGQPTVDAMRLAEMVHPNWKALGQAAQKLMARNSHQILGNTLRSPVDFVVCWTPDGCETEAERSTKTGGTGQAIAIADRWGIPVFNLARKDAVERLRVHIGA